MKQEKIMSLKKLAFNIISLFLVAVMLLAFVPQQVQAADDWVYSGANEVWMFPLGPNTGYWEITSHMGLRYVEGGSTDHQGIDVYCSKNTPIYAAKSGEVCGVGSGDGRGIFLRIDHKDGTYSQYQHLTQVLVQKGDKVKQGAKIALSGNTGGIDQYHLHFQINIDGDITKPYSTPLNSMPLNEWAFRGMDYRNNLCPNSIPASWLRAWQTLSLYKEMGISDSNSYTAKLYYPYVNLNERPAYYAGVVDAKWPPVYLQSRIRYYFQPHAKIDLKDRATYPEFETTAANTGTTYKVSVDFLQECLRDLGYNIAYDGYHGPGSTSIVKSFQAKYGISQTGNIDQATWDKVIELMHAKYPAVKKLDITDPTTYPAFTTAIPAYVSGTAAYNESAKFVQLCLSDLGYAIDADGYHGPGSTGIVRSFQQQYALTVSGSIDQATWNKIIELMVKKYHECADGDEDHLCDVCVSPLTECCDNNGDGACDICGENIFLAELQDGTLRLTKPPEDLTVLVASYTANGKLMQVQVEPDPCVEVEISVSGDKIIVFFVDGFGVPIRPPVSTQ